MIFVALAGWRLIPSACTEHDSGKELFDLDNFIAEVRVGEGSRIIGNRVRELDEAAEGADAAILGLVRRGERLSGQARRETIQKDDLLVVEASPRAIEELIGALRPRICGIGEISRRIGNARDRGHRGRGGRSAPALMGARPSRCVCSIATASRCLASSRRGVNFRERIRKLSIEAGDILLLYGPAERMSHVTDWFGMLAARRTGPAG